MLVLAFDTTSEHGGVAIYRDLHCLASAANEGPANAYSVTLFQMIDRVLAQARAGQVAPPRDLADIEFFAVANGPGSFTGIRVGLAAAQAWARAFDRPVRGISVLEAMVEEARPETDWAVPILDARRGEVFLSLFRRRSRAAAGDTGAFEAHGEGHVLKPNELGKFLLEQLPADATLACLAREQDREAQALARDLAKSLPLQACEGKSVPGFLVGAMARLALAAQREGRLQYPAELDAYYIRRSDAELNWRG